MSSPSAQANGRCLHLTQAELLGLACSMLEVGNLANATEDRTHFSAWCIVSSPLILSFNLSDPLRMDRAWPIVTNHRLLAVNQMWAGEGKLPIKACCVEQEPSYERLRVDSRVC